MWGWFAYANVKRFFLYLKDWLQIPLLYKGVIIAWSTVIYSSSRFDIPEHSMICPGHGKAAQAQAQAQAFGLLD
jgi:hypothetical protein